MKRGSSCAVHMGHSRPSLGTASTSLTMTETTYHRTDRREAMTKFPALLFGFVVLIWPAMSPAASPTTAVEAAKVFYQAIERVPLKALLDEGKRIPKLQLLARLRKEVDKAAK